MSEVFEPLLLPLEVREEMVRSLLAEFGVTTAIKSGNEFKVHCLMPWHDDRKIGNAFLSFEKLAYVCFSCGSRGGLLWLIATMRGESARSALEWVEGKTGLSGESELGPLLDLLEAIYRAGDANPALAPIPKFSPRALEPWAFIHPWLTDPQSEQGRGIPEENIIRMQVGYAEEYPMGKFPDGTPRPPARERIIVPHFWRGDLVGWQSRRLIDNDGTEKWLSTPDMPKDRTIYAMDQALGSDTVVVVESPMSALRHVHHLPIVATFGRNVTDRQVRLLAEEFDRVVYWPDSDTPGWRSVPDFCERAEEYTDVRVVASDWAGDAANLDEDDAQTLVSSAVPASIWEPPTRLRCWSCRQYHSGPCGGTVEARQGEEVE